MRHYIGRDDDTTMYIDSDEDGVELMMVLDWGDTIIYTLRDPMQFYGFVDRLFQAYNYWRPDQVGVDESNPKEREDNP